MKSTVLKKPGDCLDACLGNAANVWNCPRERLWDLQVSMWVQAFSSTGCGFSGIHGRAITKSYTVVVHDTRTDRIRVYHDRQFAYEVETPTPVFISLMEAQNVPDQVDFDKEPATYDAAR